MVQLKVEEADEIPEKDLFQFLDGSIKSIPKVLLMKGKDHFNSLMVQLKAVILTTKSSLFIRLDK